MPKKGAKNSPLLTWTEAAENEAEKRNRGAVLAHFHLGHEEGEIDNPTFYIKRIVWWEIDIDMFVKVKEIIKKYISNKDISQDEFRLIKNAYHLSRGNKHLMDKMDM